MVEVRLLIQNDEVASLRSWIEERQERLIEEMVAPVVTPTTERANTVFRVSTLLDEQLAAFQLHLATVEEAAKANRRKRK